MKRYLLTLAFIGCAAGISLAQFIPHAQIPNCNFNWSCAKVMGQTACTCTNPSINTSMDYIYTPTQVNSMESQENINNNLVNAVINAQ